MNEFEALKVVLESSIRDLEYEMTRSKKNPYLETSLMTLTIMLKNCQQAIAGEMI